MQEVVDSLRKKGKIFKKMQDIAPKELAIRNKIKIYKATDIDGAFWAIIQAKQKTKLFVKDVIKFEEIYLKLTRYCEHNFKYKVIFIDAPLCKKAKDSFKSKGWMIQL